MTYSPDSSKPDPNYPPIQLELDIQPEAQSTQLEVQPHSRHKRQWHQDPLVRTWLLPPAVGAGLGAVFGLGQFIILFVQSFIDYKVDVPSFGHLPFALFACGYLGAAAGVSVSALIAFCKLPAAQRNKILRGLWKGVCVMTLLFAVLMSFGMLSGLLGSQLNRRL